MQNQMHNCMQASALQPQHQKLGWHFSSGDALQLRWRLAAAVLQAGGKGLCFVQGEVLKL